MAHDYRTSLPKDPAQIQIKDSISRHELMSVQKRLEDHDVLQSLMEGYKPGGSVLPDEDPE
jgi:hypothetical protein